jgi:hypothetical protein
MHDVGPDRPGERVEVATERVVPTLSVPALGGSIGEPGEAGDPGESAEAFVSAAAADGDAPEFELPWASLRHLPVRVAVVAGAAALAGAVGLISGDVRVAVMCGLGALLVASAWTVDRRTPFSFGEGFVGYRPDPVWPRGVQEDDDVRWDWRPHQANGDLPAPRP